jgi:hypothetical protein
MNENEARASTMTALRKIAGNTRGKPFQPGNPGKPKGARNRATRVLEALMDESAQDVVKTIIDAAKGGDITAARLLLDRVMPARKDNSIAIDLPPMDSVSGLLAAGGAVLCAVAAGEISPGEGDAVMCLIEKQRRIIETADLEERLARLEGGAK